MTSRIDNERKFPNWEDLPNEGRKYWFDVEGRLGWRARYVKIVDSEEKTLLFYQEIYDENGKLVEMHEKFPLDKGHQKIKETEP
ncbi:MAG: hypothetical protein HY787_06975 [Deltaproteobacteria bacterium]|nr:hypothetical protein [Deltaproteobacteria bacterium]